jgi:hypothetical protein
MIYLRGVLAILEIHSLIVHLLKVDNSGTIFIILAKHSPTRGRGTNTTLAADEKTLGPVLGDGV